MGVKLTSEQWVAISRLLDQAFELPETARAAWVEALDEPDARFRSLLRDLLNAERRTDFLNMLPRIGHGDEAESGAEQGSVLGPYRLIRELGRGGMGAV